MHQLKLPVTALSLALISSTSFAGSNFFDAPYFGVEAIQTNQNYKSGYGKDVFKKNTMNYSIFAGSKFYKFLGIEAGYEVQPTATKTTLLVEGQSFPGNPPLAAGSRDLSNSTVSGTYPYIGIFAELDKQLPVFRKVKFQIIAGASFANIKASYSAFILDDPILADYTEYSKSKVIPTIKLTATSCITTNFGLRVSVNYHNLSSINIDDDVKFKNSYGIGLGLIYAF